MYAYANIHIALEKMRVRALRALHGSPPPPGAEDDNDSAEPPRVLVLGPENSGKTTVCKTLTNYAVRAGQDWSPMYVNVDPSEVRGSSIFMLMMWSFATLHLHCVSLIAGWLDNTRDYIRRFHICTTYHCFSREPPWLCRNICTYNLEIQRPLAAGLLVRARRDAS